MVGNVSFGRCLVYATALNSTVCSHTFLGIDVNLPFLHVMFSSVFESFSLTTTCSGTTCQLCKKYLSGETVVRHSDTVTSPAELVLHYRCLNARCVGRHEDTGVGAAIFLSWLVYDLGFSNVDGES